MDSVDDNNELAQLEELLCADLEEETSCAIPKKEATVEVDIFASNNNKNNSDNNNRGLDGEKLTQNTSAVHNGDTDSSDDEEKRNYTERRYNDYGTEVKKLLDQKQDEHQNRRLEFETRLRQTNIDVKIAHNNSFKKNSDNVETKITKNLLCAPETKSKTKFDIYTDPVFGIRITKPLISSTALLDRMQGREAINMLRVKRHIENEDLSQDWVTAGVIVRKSTAKKSQKGNNFLIWTLSDLKDDLKTISMFLFRKAYTDLWKTNEGTVVAVLNPNVLDKSQNSADQACLSVDNPDRVMILGQSKDFGICKSKKKNGDPCTTFVNLAHCEHCIYHIKQEYQKYSGRQELQSSTMGKGLVSLQNKVFGKSTVIYGGKAYSALPTGNNKKIKEKDQNRLMSLSEYNKIESDSLMSNRAPYGAGPMKNSSVYIHSPVAKKTSDSERLTKLNSSPKLNIQQNKCGILSQGPSLAEKVASSPKLGKGFSLTGSGTVDLNISYGQKAAEKAKANAIRLIHKSGGLSKLDPNNTKGTEAGKKRALEKLNLSGNDENDSKKFKRNENEEQPTSIKSERFKKILEATSAHQNLIDQHEENEQAKYFSKLEKKEAMEEKMLNTFKMACKAVRCVKCKYTAFSASQSCKDKRHPLKILDTFKRFFKCADCSNRTVSLDIIPLHTCSNCKGSRWEKAPMLRERKGTNLAQGLSIRGEEETFIGGMVTSGKNINLLVPE